MKLYQGDCLEVMRELPDKSVIVVTDPPYGIKRFKKGFGTTRFKGYGVEKNGIIWDNKPNQEIFDEMFRIGKIRVIWGANNFLLPASECFLVWDKQQTVPNFASAELAYCDAKGVTAKVFRYSIHKHNHSEKYHPTQKPVDLMKWCIELVSKETDVIFDPFMGSGTTGIAAVQLGRDFIGCEINPSYYGIAERRITEAQKNRQLELV